MDVPMYFVYRDNKYIDVTGHSFRDYFNVRSGSPFSSAHFAELLWLLSGGLTTCGLLANAQGKSAVLPGQRPTLVDFENHLTTAFPEVSVVELYRSPCDLVVTRQIKSSA